MASKNTRSVKIYGMSGYKYQATPTIILKGKWLEELGFEIGDYISVSCEDGKIIITPDAERAALAEAEQEFMEREMASIAASFHLCWSESVGVVEILCKLLSCFDFGISLGFLDAIFREKRIKDFTLGVFLLQQIEAEESTSMIAL